MALKAILKSLEGLSDEVKKLYVEKDGAFHLDVEGVVDKTRHDSLREENIAQRKQLEDLAKKFEGIDPDKVKDILKQEAALKEKKLLDSGKVEELFQERTKAMQADNEAKQKTLTEQLAKAQAQMDRLVVDNSLHAESAKAHVKTKAVTDVVNRGKSLFSAVDGKAVAMTSDGKVIYGKDGSTPLSIQEWMGNLQAEASHLFEGSNGSGANGSGNGTNGLKSVTRSEFEKLDPMARGALAKEVSSGKAKITD